MYFFIEKLGQCMQKQIFFSFFFVLTLTFYSTEETKLIRVFVKVLSCIGEDFLTSISEN